jgi:hypothetical protein
MIHLAIAYLTPQEIDAATTIFTGFGAGIGALLVAFAVKKVINWFHS